MVEPCLLLCDAMAPSQAAIARQDVLVDFVAPHAMAPSQVAIARRDMLVDFVVPHAMAVHGIFSLMWAACALGRDRARRLGEGEARQSPVTKNKKAPRDS